MKIYDFGYGIGNVRHLWAAGVIQFAMQSEGKLENIWNFGEKFTFCIIIECQGKPSQLI